eukprot:777173-Pleurochrysis_carterae.AAC.2
MSFISMWTLKKAGGRSRKAELGRRGGGGSARLFVGVAGMRTPRAAALVAGRPRHVRTHVAASTASALFAAQTRCCCSWVSRRAASSAGSRRRWAGLGWARRRRAAGRGGAGFLAHAPARRRDVRRWEPTGTSLRERASLDPCARPGRRNQRAPALLAPVAAVLGRLLLGRLGRFLRKCHRRVRPTSFISPRTSGQCDCPAHRHLCGSDDVKSTCA